MLHRIVFLGASKFGLRCLDLLHSLDGCTIAGVVTLPERFSISYRPQGVKNILYADIGEYCEEKEIPAVTLKGSMNDEELIESVKAWQPKLFVVAGWYHLIPAKWRNIAPSYGLHASLLPDYSGGAPLVWAMINGEERTGISLFKMEDGVDNGPIVGQKETPIYKTDTIATLYDRIENLGIELLRDNIPLLIDGSAELIEQDESRRRVVPQRSPEDGLIDFNRSVVFVERFIRAQTKPYPGAFTPLNNDKLTIWKSELCSEQDKINQLVAEPIQVGDCIVIDKNVAIKCKDGYLKLLQIGYQGVDYEGDELINFYLSYF